MSDYFGDIRLGDTIDIKFTTRQISGAPSTLSGTPVISAYPANSTTQLTAGITLSVDFDAVTGYNNVRVVATSGNGYATATNYDLCITTGTVNSVSVVGESIGSFSIENRSALMPTTAARTLVVDAAGLADANAVKVGPTGSGTAQTAGDIYSKVSALTFTIANQVDVNVVDWKGAAAAAMTGDAFARLGAPAGASTAADIAAVKVDTAAVKVQTDKLTFTVTNVVDANMLRTNGDATAAANVAKTTRAIGRGTVNGVPTTTSIPTSAFAPTGVDADQFKGRIITFDADTTTTNLRGQSTDITANTAAAAPTFTVTALTVAPAVGDTFSVT